MNGSATAVTHRVCPTDRLPSLSSSLLEVADSAKILKIGNLKNFIVPDLTTKHENIDEAENMPNLCPDALCPNANLSLPQRDVKHEGNGALIS